MTASSLELIEGEMATACIEAELGDPAGRGRAVRALLRLVELLTERLPDGDERTRAEGIRQSFTSRGWD